MIKYLKIKNFSIIKDLYIEFDSGLNVIHGESGSGKSLILTALSILSGSNSSSSLIREGEEKAILECEIEEIGIIQKIIGKNKSTQNLDGENITVARLKELVGRRIENFSQGEQEEIYTKKYQNSFVRQFLKSEEVIMAFHYANWYTVNNKLNELLSTIEQKRERAGLYEFYLKEIDEVRPQLNEEESLENRIRVFSNQEVINQEKSLISELLQSAISNIKSSESKTDKLTKYSIVIQNRSDEILGYLDEWLSQVSIDEGDREESLDDLNARLYNIQKLKKKLGKKTIDEVLRYEKQIRLELSEVDNFEEEVEKLKSNLKTYSEKYESEDKDFHKLFLKEATRLSEELTEQLKGVGFNHVFVVGNTKSGGEYKTYGTSEIEFQVSFNKGFSPQPMSKIVSGGEASRLALCMKLLSNKTNSILILDEVDTGLSGQTVKALSDKLKQIPDQIICVTHSKEIIDSGDKKIEVYKEEIESRTETKIRYK